ncbi:MAG: MFS transporter [Halolamina sp.]
MVTDTVPAPTGSGQPTDTPTSDRWLYAWATGYAAVGGASLLLPLYALSLGADAFYVGLMASTAAFAGVPGALLWGRLASRTGRRRPFVLVALVATTLVLLLSPLLSSPAMLVVGNAALWFVVSAASPVLNLVVVEGVEQSAWDGRIARLNALQGWGWLAGLLVGTVWTVLAPKAGIDPLTAQRVLLGGFGGVAAVAVLLFARFYPPAPHTSPERFASGYRRIARTGFGAGRYLRAVPYGPTRIYWGLRALRSGGIRDRFGGSLVGYLAAVTLFSAGFSVFWGPMPAYLVGLGFSDGVIFLCFLAGTVGSTVCYEPVADLTERFQAQRLQLGALGVRAALFVGTAFIAGAVLVGGAFVAIGVTWAVIAVTTTGIVTRLATERVRGEALGLVAALAGLGGGIGNAVGGAIAAAVGAFVTFALAAVLVATGGLLGVYAAGR